MRLRPQLPIADDPLWITFDHPQSRSLLARERVEYVPYLRPRDYRKALVVAPAVTRILRSEEFGLAISTGAAIAGVVLPISNLMRKESWYIESVSRTHGPSLTGKLVKAIPGIECMTQHERWAGGGWNYKYSVLSDYISNESPGDDLFGQTRPARIYVTLGTIQPYRFDRVIDRLKEILPPSTEVVWQLGATERHDLWGTVASRVSREKHREYIDWADVVISHAGVGTALQILDAGKSPVLLARSRHHNEHVDDHQQFIIDELSRRNLIIKSCVEELSLDYLNCAARLKVAVTGRDQPEIVLPANPAHDSGDD
ncbi:glycosyltransferase [Gordonia amicalis]|uniref:glycosyltransferase n=1 Tax=Gordonia amicalis TaxID=89053 RepID=UPI0015F5997F|nr:glycosyltransferase [Gordonia amicalis]MBA5847040.1 glycosyltransferase [Gordonia amicalis]